MANDDNIFPNQQNQRDDYLAYLAAQGASVPSGGNTTQAAQDALIAANATRAELTAVDDKFKDDEALVDVTREANNDLTLTFEKLGDGTQRTETLSPIEELADALTINSATNLSSLGLMVNRPDAVAVAFHITADSAFSASGADTIDVIANGATIQTGVTSEMIPAGAQGFFFKQGAKFIVSYVTGGGGAGSDVIPQDHAATASAGTNDGLSRDDHSHKFQEVSTTADNLLKNDATDSRHHLAIVDILNDEDDLVSNDDTKGATQQSVKAYIDRRAPLLQALGWVKSNGLLVEDGGRRMGNTAVTFARMNATGEVESFSYPAEDSFEFQYYDRNGIVNTGFDGSDVSAPQTVVNQLVGYDDDGTLASIVADTGDSNDGVIYRFYMNPLTGDMAVLLPQIVVNTVNNAFIRYSDDHNNIVLPAALSGYVYMGYSVCDENAGNFTYTISTGKLASSGGAAAAVSEVYKYVADNTARDALVEADMTEGGVVGVGVGADYVEYRVVVLGATFAASTTEIIYSAESVMSLTGTVNADVQMLGKPVGVPIPFHTAFGAVTLTTAVAGGFGENINGDLVAGSTSLDIPIATRGTMTLTSSGMITVEYVQHTNYGVEKADLIGAATHDWDWKESNNFNFHTADQDTITLNYPTNVRAGDEILVVFYSTNAAGTTFKFAPTADGFATNQYTTMDGLAVPDLFVGNGEVVTLEFISNNGQAVYPKDYPASAAKSYTGIAEQMQEWSIIDSAFAADIEEVTTGGSVAARLNKTQTNGFGAYRLRRDLPNIQPQLVTVSLAIDATEDVAHLFRLGDAGGVPQAKDLFINNLTGLVTKDTASTDDDITIISQSVTGNVVTFTVQYPEIDDAVEWDILPAVGLAATTDATGFDNTLDPFPLDIFSIDIQPVAGGVGTTKPVEDKIIEQTYDTTTAVPTLTFSIGQTWSSFLADYDFIRVEYSQSDGVNGNGNFYPAIKGDIPVAEFLEHGDGNGLIYVHRSSGTTGTQYIFRNWNEATGSYVLQVNPSVNRNNITFRMYGIRSQSEVVDPLLVPVVDLHETIILPEEKLVNGTSGAVFDLITKYPTWQDAVNEFEYFDFYQNRDSTANTISPPFARVTKAMLIEKATQLNGTTNNTQFTFGSGSTNPVNIGLIDLSSNTVQFRLGNSSTITGTFSVVGVRAQKTVIAPNALETVGQNPVARLELTHAGMPNLGLTGLGSLGMSIPANGVSIFPLTRTDYALGDITTVEATTSNWTRAPAGNIPSASDVGFKDVPAGLYRYVFSIPEQENSGTTNETDVADNDRPFPAIIVNGAVVKTHADNTYLEHNDGSTSEYFSMGSVQVPAGASVQLGMIIEGGDSEEFDFQSAVISDDGGGDAIYGFFEIQKIDVDVVQSPNQALTVMQDEEAATGQTWVDGSTIYRKILSTANGLIGGTGGTGSTAPTRQLGALPAASRLLSASLSSTSSNTSTIVDARVVLDISNGGDIYFTHTDVTLATATDVHAIVEYTK